MNLLLLLSITISFILVATVAKKLFKFNKERKELNQLFL